MTIAAERDQRKEDFWNTAALVALLAVMAGMTSGGVIFALFQHLGKQFNVTISLSGLLLSGGLVAVIIYVLANPLHEIP